MKNFIDRFEQAFYYSPIGMALVSLNGNWLKVNPALSKITGYTEKELLSNNFQNITHPDDLGGDVNQVRELVVGKKEYYEMEKRYIHKNGSIVWILLSVSIVREGNQSLYLIAQVQDITNRKQLERNLTESEERFRTLLTYTPDPILVHDGDIIMYANESAANLVGTTVDKMVGDSYQKFIDPIKRDKAIGFTQEIMVHNKPFIDFDIIVQSENGQRIDAVLSAIPITFSGKRAVLVSLRDITERKRMVQALKDSEGRFRRLVENSPLGILVHQNGLISYANLSALRLLGTENPEDLIGSHILNRIHPDYRMIVSRRIESVEKKGQDATRLYEKFIRLDGQVIDVEVTGIPIQLNGESAVQVLFWDVTEKKKQEDLIHYRAYHDTLTDLPNRLKFQLDLEEEMNKDSLFTIMYLDLNGIISVNETHGHQAGDMALIKVSAKLSGVLGSNGLIYRLGGTEFAIVLSGQKNEEEIRELSNHIAENIKRPIYISNSIVQLSPNIGVVFYPDHGVDMELLLRHADMAMYHAKNTNTIYKIYDR